MRLRIAGRDEWLAVRVLEGSRAIAGRKTLGERLEDVRCRHEAVTMTGRHGAVNSEALLSRLHRRLRARDITAA